MFTVNSLHLDFRLLLDYLVWNFSTDKYFETEKWYLWIIYKRVWNKFLSFYQWFLICNSENNFFCKKSFGKYHVCRIVIKRLSQSHQTSCPNHRSSIGGKTSNYHCVNKNKQCIINVSSIKCGLIHLLKVVSIFNFYIALQGGGECQVFSPYIYWL